MSQTKDRKILKSFSLAKHRARVKKLTSDRLLVQQEISLQLSLDATGLRAKRFDLPISVILGPNTINSRMYSGQVYYSPGSKSLNISLKLTNQMSLSHLEIGRFFTSRGKVMDIVGSLYGE